MPGVVAVAKGAAARAQKDALALEGTCSETPAYLGLREHTATLAQLLRPWASASAEVLTGPERPIGEGAGALADLDLALGQGDCEGAKEALSQVRKALVLAGVELDAARMTDERAGEAVQRAAFELGLVLAEASLSTPRSHEAALADARGTLRAVREGARALGDARAVEAALRPIDAALSGAKRLSDVPRRAALVRRTGDVAEAVAGMLHAKGFVPRGIHSVEGATRVSALDLPPHPKDAPALVRLGRRLFEDKRFSKGEQRACAGCHLEAMAFGDGLRVPPSIDPKATIARNTPTVLYAYAAAVQRWDGRLVVPDAQAIAVLHTKAEMGITAEATEAILGGDAGYRAAFDEVGLPLTEASVGRALGAYVESLGPGSSPIDRYARGDDGALGDDDHRGFDLFTGKARCARCHVPPTFGGSRAPLFQLPIYGVLGVPKTKDGRTLDPDPGRGAVTKLAADLHAFKTPTVRDAARTGPYFHNGSYDTLAEVVSFYDRGGGKGLGIVVDNQDPDVVPLELTEEERRLLVRFLTHTLADAR